MPNVTSPNTVSFGNLIAPDLASQQLALQRRQQAIDLLRQQALAPMEQQVVTGAGPAQVVKNSPWQGVAKMFAGYLAGKGQDDVDAANAQINRDMAQRMAQILNGNAPANVASPVALADGAAQGSLGPTTANAARMNSMTRTPGINSEAPAGDGPNFAGGNGGDSAFSMANLLRGSVISQVGGAPAASAYYDQFKTPDSVKTNNYYGLDRKEVADALRRKNAAEGNQVVSQDATLTRANPDGSVTPLFTAPNITTGTNINWQGGQPVANAIPGADKIAADRAAATTAATEQEKAARDMITMNTPQGPKMVTRAQAVAMAGGLPAGATSGAQTPPAAGMPAARPNAMAPQPADADRVQIFTSELAKAQDRLANPAKYMSPAELQADPDGSKFRSRAQSDVAGITREMGRVGVQPNPAATPGIPLQSEGQSKFEQAMGGKQADLLDDSYKKARIASDDLMGISESRKALKAGAFVGSLADTKLAVAKFVNGNIPGVTIDPNRVAETDYLKSTLGKGLLEQAKTLGSNPSNADANRINDIVGSIGKDPNALQKMLDWRQEMAQRAINLHNSNVGQAVQNGFRPQFDMTVKLPAAPTAPARGFRIIGVQQ
jgi:hypothetical protein